VDERALLRPSDDRYLLDLVREAQAASPLSMADVVSAGRAVYPWLTVDADIERCLSCAPEAAIVAFRSERDLDSRDDRREGRRPVWRG
jgi:hypothetical protein